MPFCANCGEIISGKKDQACLSCGKSGVAKTAAGLEETDFNNQKSKSTYMNAYLSNSLVDNLEATNGTKTSIDQELKKTALDLVAYPQLSVTSAGSTMQTPNKTCPGCHKQVSGRGISFSGNSYYHPFCFKCFFCSRQLQTSEKLFEHDGEPVCEQCSGASSSVPRVPVAQKQQQLNQAIKDTGSAAAALQGFVEDFAKSSDGNRRVLEQLCDDCLEPIKGFEEKVLLEKHGKQYHATCFRCAVCHKVIKGTTFLNRDGKFMHVECDGASRSSSQSSDNCEKCGKSIYTGKYLQFDDKMYHKACFTCDACHCEVGTSPFSLITNKIYCSKCVDKKMEQAQQSQKNSQLESSMSRSNSSISSLNRFKPSSQDLQLGGSSDCTLCNTKVYPQEEAFGPNVTRWHKKCLVCMKCKKQLDSAATIRRNDTGAILLLCRNCS